VAAYDEPGSALTFVALHPDGCRAVSGNAKGELRLWDPRASCCLWSINAHGARITGAAIDAVAGRILSTSWDKTLKVWDMESGQGLETHSGHSRVVGIFERPSGASRYWAVSRSFDCRTLKIWALTGGEREKTLTHPLAGFLSFAFLPDGQRVVSGGWEGQVNLWDLETGACLEGKKVHQAAITTTAVLRDGLRVITGDASGALGVWNLETGAVRLIPDAHRGRVMSLSVACDERSVAVSGGADERVRGWDLTTFQRISEWTAASTVTTSALGRSAPRPIDQGYRLPALVSSRTLVAIGDEAGNLSFFEWSPFARPFAD
jgi:WD40 repeat protein